MTKSTLKRFALALLDDDHGITTEAWVFLCNLLLKDGLEDIVDKVRATDNRFYLTADDAEDLRK